MQLQNRLSTTFHKNCSLLAATSSLSSPPVAHNTTASLVKFSALTMCTQAKAKTDLVKFRGAKKISNIWMQKFSRKMTIKSSD